MSYPVPYVRRNAPQGAAATSEYLRVELMAIQATLAQVLAMLPQEATAAPSQPQNGMIRKAMSPWRPVSGTTTDAWVIYDGGAWTLL